MGKFGETKGWVGKVACLNTKAAISLKRVKLEEKLLRRTYRNSPTLFRTVPSPTPYGLLFPKIGVRNPHPKLQSLLSHERVKLQTSNLYTGYIHARGPSKRKPIIKVGEKGPWAYRETAQLFGLPPIISRTGKD